jgi:starch synthase (maltosyl-transferring)
MGLTAGGTTESDVTERPINGRQRVIVDAIRPQTPGIDRYPLKRVLGDELTVEVDLLADGHDQLAGVLCYRPKGSTEWRETPLSFVDSDRWRASFVLDALGVWEYTVRAWVDPWASWAWGLKRKIDAKQDIEVELQGGSKLALGGAERAAKQDRATLQRLAERLSDRSDVKARVDAAVDPEMARVMRGYPDLVTATLHEPPLEVIVDPVLARFSSWYEMFPRSSAATAEAGPPHGSLREAESRLRYVAELGFDVVYLPPIHPIGRTYRKGKDNSLTATAGDPGSPWAIGSAEGGHKSIHPDLGTLADFRHFVEAAKAQHLAVAMDIAFQASPDHPYVKEHPEWFVHRADGTIQYAENPPKKYQDIYPFDLAGPAWESLWHELRDVFLFWSQQGIHVFRVDNPHTKPLRFWEWCIRTVKQRHPETIFLAEAFTRPKLMHLLAKLGFSQSYTYFTWRTTKGELTEYARSLVETEVGEFFRPNFWPNTPDILPEHLQFGTAATFIARAALAATLSPSWGIYGPAYELKEQRARPGAEEYANNEKYEIRSWDLSRADSLAPIIRRLNQIRHENPALQRLAGTVFHPTDNEQLICYSRATDDRSNVLLVIVNLDPHHQHAGWISLDLAALGVADNSSFQVHDLVGDARYLWRGGRAFVSLDPKVMPVHVFRVRRLVRTEQSFEYYL